MPRLLRQARGRGQAVSTPRRLRLGTVSEGETLEDAVANLREAVGLYLEEFPLSAHGAIR